MEFVKKFDEKMPDKLKFFEKGDVNGASTREVYSLLKGKLPNEDGTADVRWNFGKMLISVVHDYFWLYLYHLTVLICCSQVSSRS